MVTQKESKTEDIVGQGHQAEEVINSVPCFRQSGKIKVKKKKCPLYLTNGKTMVILIRMASMTYEVAE